MLAIEHGAVNGSCSTTSSDPNPHKIGDDAATIKKYKSMFLRRLVKENHGEPIYQCGFAPKPPGAKVMAHVLRLYSELNYGQDCDHGDLDSSNIFCTVGGQQLNTYDSMHCGDHLDLVSHFSTSYKSGDTHRHGSVNRC